MHTIKYGEGRRVAISWMMGFCFTVLILNGYSQSTRRNEKTDEFINLNLSFTRNRELSDKLFMHYFVPKQKVKAFLKDGKMISLSTTDTIFAHSIEKGSFGGYSGNWIKKVLNIEEELYVPFDNNMIDVTEFKGKLFRAAYRDMVSERLIILFWGVVPFLLLGLYVWRVSPERIKPPWLMM